MLVDRRLEGSYRLARAILHDAADAEDATHDAIVTAWRKWPTLREPGRFDHWFNRIHRDLRVPEIAELVGARPSLPADDG